MIAEVLQYLRPDGRQVTRRVTIPDGCQKQYDLIHWCGCKLTCEQFMDERAAQYISNGDGDFDCVITAARSPWAAVNALVKMIKAFDKDEFEKWNKQFEEPNGA